MVRMKGDHLSRIKMLMPTATTATSQYLASILWILLLSSIMNSVEKEVDSEFVYSSKRSTALRVVRHAPTSSEDPISAQIAALDFKILGYLSSDPSSGLSTNDLMNIITGLHEEKLGPLADAKHIINTRLYAMLQSNKVAVVQGCDTMWLRLD